MPQTPGSVAWKSGEKIKYIGPGSEPNLVQFVFLTGWQKGKICECWSDDFRAAYQAKEDQLRHNQQVAFAQLKKEQS